MPNDNDFEDFLNNEQTQNQIPENEVLHVAVEENDFAKLQTLIKRGYNVNEQTDDGWTPLHFAAYRGYLEITRFLLDNMANTDIQGKVYSRTPMHYAADQGHLEVVRELLMSGANSRIVDRNGFTPLEIAQQRGYHEIVNLIRSYRH